MNEKIKSITFKNYHLFFLNNLLSGNMQAKEARIRNQFFGIIKDRFDLVEKERINIATKYAERDENGKVKINKEGGYEIKNERLDDLNKEYVELMKEDFILDVLPSVEPILLGLKKILDGVTKELNIQEGTSFDEILTILETV